MPAGTMPAGEGLQAEETRPPASGFVVWESNRGGSWRIWIRDLDGTPERQLSPDEGERQHCCPHVAPGGERIAYLSLARGQEVYPESGATGRLYTLAVDGSDARRVVDRARTYFEHRAAVWRSPSELIFIDGDGNTQQLDVAQGTLKPLAEMGAKRHGWLVNATLTHATTGLPSFSAYDADRRRIVESGLLGGCQPYFSLDGRWGFWVAGAGGPIRSLDLASGAVGEILGKSDPRLPRDRGYLYFPMLSHDGSLFAWGASADEHDHMSSNYDVFVAPTDPDTLQLIGQPWQVTSHPGVDRFPDVYSAPLALGRHFGEAPLRIEFVTPDDAASEDATAETMDWQWSLGSESLPAKGSRVEHTFESAGSYRVVATSGERQALGFVRVREARPPQVIEASVRDSKSIDVRFDEAVALDAVQAELESGRALQVLPAGGAQGADDRSLRIELEEALDTDEVLVLSGVRDRAQRPNVMPQTRIEIGPPMWPSDPRGLVFLWQSDGVQEVEDPVTGERRSCVLSPSGRAWLDRSFAMELAGGSFVANDETVLGVLNGCQRTNELTLEATLTPHRRAAPDAMARIITFSGGRRSRNLTLGQIDDRLVFRLRTATTGQNADRPQLELSRVPIGKPTHVLITYTAGRLVAYLDGREVLTTDALQDGFFHWQPRPLVFGNEWQADFPWFGSLEGVAIYDRALAADEALENHRRYAELRAEVPAVARVRLRARLVQRSAIPTLREIAPYREALAVYVYEIEALLSGEPTGAMTIGSQVRIAHRVLADGEALPVSRRATSRSYALEIEPFLDQPQLESLYLSDTVSDASGQLFFSSEVEP
ncbi:MAG: LamG-like jellyroll fold domain-containing protein [Acidobacteriota bacterium]